MTRVGGMHFGIASELETDARAEPGEWSDDDFLNEIAQRLTPEETRVKEALERVKSVYVPCGRDKKLAKQFSEFTTNMLAKRNGRRDDGRVFFVTGESGAGKTEAVNRLLESSPLLQPVRRSYGVVNPLVKVTLMGPTTLRMLGLSIVRNAGYKLTRKLQQGEVWDLIPEQMHHRKALVVHIDEAQHMIKLTASDTARDEVTKAFKGVMNYPAWPVSFVMTGMPETIRLASLDEQIERRGYFALFPDVSLPDERVLVEEIIARMCEAAALDPLPSIQSDLPERIAHAARYRYGRITQVVLAAIGKAVSRSASALHRDHFKAAYIDHSHARGHEEMNPFEIDDWRNLPPGCFLIEREAD